MKRNSKFLWFLFILLCPMIFFASTENAHAYDDGGMPQFDGEAYFCWVNGDGTVSYHKFTNLEGGSTVNYIASSELTDDSENGCNYQWGQEPANWTLAKDMEDNDGNLKPEVTTEYVFGDGMYDMGIQLDPCSDVEGANSILSNADRNFRSIIYLEGEYEALTFAATVDEYQYFPSFWDPTFFTSTVDISGTTKENPAVYKTYLLEPTIKFRVNPHSKSPIKSVKALDVNNQAVNVEKDEQTGEFTVGFNSNYYDRVVFEMEDEDGGKYYFMPQRIVLNASDNFGPDMTEAKVNAAFFYPRNYGHTDFDVIATVQRYDQKPVTSVLEAMSLENPEPGMEVVLGVGELGPDNYTSDGGKGLYASVYPVSLGSDIKSGAEVMRKVKGVGFTVVHKGALSGDVYGGTFSGSGKGTFYDAITRKIK